ncbi:MerR family transcriptional regulator [Desertihabitans brevis]|uniref:MerR family transcriptional regulator n=1 Tax=Desertihabitans brevis TaxID=2268447 RepID=A0A367YSM0_9ACTN|nr:MerR family transcriptional regulator [Desertihabitans brevis]RCK68549.1 MerR family transcriptional regulator [Desertihabitans brevis]
MLSIGDFARLGQVSVRMLRHYDAIGVLVPARVDPCSGYRSYDPSQLARLHRVIALKELGFSLAEVGVLLDEELTGEQLRGMLRLRRSQLAAEHAAATARLADVELRLRIIEKEHHMSEHEYVSKPLPALRLAAATADLPPEEAIGTVVGPLFGSVAGAVAAAGGSLRTPVAVYRSVDDQLRVTAGYEHAGGPGDGFELVEVPAAGEALCTVHLGAMETIGATWQALHEAIGERGAVPDGPAREVYLRASPDEDQSQWVTELQQPVSRP